MQRQVSLPFVITALLAGCAAPNGPPVSIAEGSANTTAASVDSAATAVGNSDVTGQSFGAGMVVEEFGVRLTDVRLTANGYVIDLRYRVLDPAKAQPLLDRKVRPVLVDEATGNRFYVPVPPTVGALRQVSRNKVIHTDRDYFMLFANPDRRLQAGSKVTLYVGDQRFGNLQIASQSAASAMARPPERSGGAPSIR